MPAISASENYRLVEEGFNVVICDSKNKKTLMDGGVAYALRKGVIDADGAFFFQRQLEYIKARSYDVRYADLKARTLFPVSNEGGRGITSIVYRTYDQAGVAKIVNAYADDLPRADVAGKETRVPVRLVADSYGYNIKEIEAAQLTGEPLDQRRANAARRAIEQVVNNVAFFGDSISGLPGLFDNPNIPIGPVVDPGPGTTWADKIGAGLPDAVLFDVNDLFADIFEVTKGVETPNRLIIPPAQWSLIMSTPRSPNSDTTIAQYIANNSPYINSVADIEWANECTAANNPLLSEDAMVAYNKQPDKLELSVPVEMEFLTVQEKNLEFIVPGRLDLAGLIIYYPLSLAIATGI